MPNIWCNVKQGLVYAYYLIYMYILITYFSSNFKKIVYQNIRVSRHAQFMNIFVNFTYSSC